MKMKNRKTKKKLRPITPYDISRLPRVRMELPIWVVPDQGIGQAIEYTLPCAEHQIPRMLEQAAVATNKERIVVRLTNVRNAPFQVGNHIGSRHPVAQAAARNLERHSKEQGSEQCDNDATPPSMAYRGY